MLLVKVKVCISFHDRIWYSSTPIKSPKMDTLAVQYSEAPMFLRTGVVGTVSGTDISSDPASGSPGE